jgi:serine/threonine-protein kinase
MRVDASGTLTDGDLSGRRLGGYRLLRRLGSGAMADVYLAEQESLGRQVAVKVLAPRTAAEPIAVQRFTQEARAAAALIHGHIVQIHEVACIDGIHFLAEEYVAGPTLKAWLEARGPLDAAQAVALLGQVGSALARAAEQGVVHRDIKPENLLVTSAGEVKVADFGLARVLDAADGLGLTQHGMTLGTPLYMSPEQAEGKSVDARSDLYSLGATVYHLLAGRPPFNGTTSLAVAMAHIKEPLTPIASLRPELPAELAAIVDRLLAKDPAARFQSPGDLLRAVERCEASLEAGSRHGPSPLAWTAESEWGRPGLPQRGGMGQARQPVRTQELRDATVRLQAAMEREQLERDSSRRIWMATAAAAIAAMIAGFVAGRARPRGPARIRPPR